MEELVPRQHWSAQGERQLRAILDSAGLKFSFRRPRATVARRALFHMIAELLNAGMISSEQVTGIEPLLTFDDPLLLLIEPMQRPDQVASIPRRDRYSERNEQWLERIEEARQVVSPYFESDWRVIAEETTLKILDWEVPTEMRRSVVRPSDSASVEVLFTNVPASRINAYWDMDVEPDVRSLAIRNGAFMYDTIGTNWIGFNPKLARDLGWKPGVEGMLSWEDGSGRILAKTLWWTDGALQQYPPAFDEKLGADGLL